MGFASLFVLGWHSRFHPLSLGAYTPADPLHRHSWHHSQPNVSGLHPGLLWSLLLCPPEAWVGFNSWFHRASACKKVDPFEVVVFVGQKYKLSEMTYKATAAGSAPQTKEGALFKVILTQPAA